MENPPWPRYTLARGFPIGAHTGPSAGRWSAGDRGREPASAVGLPAAGLRPPSSSPPEKGGEPVTCFPTGICEVVASFGGPRSPLARSPFVDPGTPPAPH